MPSRAAETVGDVIRYLDPGAITGPGPVWPPDAFAIAATILKRSGAYRKVANVWPPARYDDTNAWHDATTAIADEWRVSCDASAPAFPVEVQNWWNTVVGKESAVLSDVLDDVDLFESLVALVAVCDSACRSFGFDESGSASDAQQRANRNLSLRQSLCEAIHPSHCVVLPKAHNPVAGMTLRSLTHNLALWDKPEVSARWENIDLAIAGRMMNLLLVPWPLRVDPDAFHEAIDCHELRLPNRVGLFDYDISFTDADIAKVRSLVDRAKAEVGTIDGIVFPELAMSLKQFAMVQEAVQDALPVSSKLLTSQYRTGGLPTGSVLLTVQHA